MISSLYIHIPFCMKKCIYCDFFSVPYDGAPARNYITSVARELTLRKEAAGEIRTVYIGGGTPTTLPVGELTGLLQKIRDSFTIAGGAEITVEANPGTLDKEKADALTHAGVNRFSIGVQSFDNNELTLLGRMHSVEDAREAFALVRDAGIRNVSLDLIYGIPGQTMDGWSRTITMALELSPDHISAYELTPEKGTPLSAAILKGELEKPPEEVIVDMYYHAIDRLSESGYRHYEISNFAKPGFECRHNLVYWNRGRYIGIGAGAHSFIGNRRIRNVHDIGRYAEALQKGQLPAEESVELSGEEAMRESVFLGLRKTEGVNISELRKAFAIDVVRAAAELRAQGLLEVGADHLRLTKKGIVVSNAVIAELFQRLSPQYS